jgi:transcriptional regulator with XRE-family HTH domain
MAPILLADVIRTNLRTLREQRNWSQGDLALRMRSLGMTRCTGNAIAQIETGRVRSDRILDLALFAQAFGKPLTALLAGDGEIHVDARADTVKSLLDLRMAVVGEAPPPADDVHAQITEEYNLDRIAVQAGLDSTGALRMITLALWDQQDFLILRDEYAGLAITGGTRANIAARRGQATRRLISEIAREVALVGVDELVERGIAKLHARAVEGE